MTTIDKTTDAYYEMENFLREHDACRDGREWALTECSSLQEVWNTAKPEWLVWVATRKGVLSHHDLIRFACFCARQNWDMLTDVRSRNAITVAENFLVGKVTRDDCIVAANAANAA